MRKRCRGLGRSVCGFVSGYSRTAGYRVLLYVLIRCREQLLFGKQIETPLGHQNVCRSAFETKVVDADLIDFRNEYFPWFSLFRWKNNKKIKIFIRPNRHLLSRSFFNTFDNEHALLILCVISKLIFYCYLLWLIQLRAENETKIRRRHYYSVH